MRPAVRNILETLFCIVVLALLAGAVLHRAVLHDEAPIVVDSTLFELPWVEARPAEMAAPRAPDTAAVTEQFYPWYVFLSDSARTGNSLMWNPSEQLGTPFYATWRTRCLSPFSLPFYLAPPARALQVSTFLKLLIAGLCALYAGRRLGLHLPIALFFAAAFQLSGPFFLWRTWPMTDVLPWTPLLLVFSERIALGGWRYWPLGVLIMTVMLLGGDPESAGAAFCTFAVYLAARQLFARQRLAVFAGGAAVYVFSGAIAVTLAGVQVVPFIELMHHVNDSGAVLSNAALRVSDLIVALLPRFFGAPDAALAASIPPLDARVTAMLHVGFFQVLLLPLWFALRRFALPVHRQRVEALMVAAVASTAFAFGLASPDLVNPLATYAAPEHFLAVAPLMFAFMAAATADEWLTLDAAACASTLKRLLLSVPLFLAAFGAIAYFAWTRLGPVIPSDMALEGVGAGAAFLLLLLVLTLTLRWPKPRLMGYAMTVLTCAQLAWVFYPFAPWTPPALLFPQTPVIEALKSAGGRIGGSPQLETWPLSANGIAQVYGTAGPRLSRYEAFAEVARTSPEFARRMAPDALLLTGDDMQGPYGAIRDDLHVTAVLQPGAVICTDDGALGRARLAYDVRVVPDYDPSRLDPALPPLVEAPLTLSGQVDRDATVTVEPPRSNDLVTIHVEHDAPGVLILADAWYPGWDAAIDGADAPTFPVDGALRGVLVPEGAHTVTFQYQPQSLLVGIFASLVAAALALAGLVRLLFVRLHRAKKTEAWV